ncbi:hypothetical protein F5Y05DRAFT_373537 [Hypoxylon sp. FL0543]|nr:hypothetical protein F5Y05DRAFT_373537 [Hypoxylon sp. FL0543]
MMDDVLGLVMVQIVSSLGAAAGGGGGKVDIDVGNTVLRPVLVSLAFAVGVPLACRFVLRPLLHVTGGGRATCEKETKASWWRRGGFLDENKAGFVAQTALLLALVVGASFAGASVLLAAYLAGIVVAWWDDLQRYEMEKPGEQSLDGSTPASELPRAEELAESSEESTIATRGPGISEGAAAADCPSTTPLPPTRLESQLEQAPRRGGSDIYEMYYSHAVGRILKPFFFASIGFSIPISDMFSGEIVWRGIIYSILMAIGKILCGLWLVRFPVSMGGLADRFGSFISSRYRLLFSRFRRHRNSNSPPSKETSAEAPASGPTSRVAENATSRSGQRAHAPSQRQQLAAPTSRGNDSPRATAPTKPLSLYPAAIVSSAMVARGEIGFLISAVAESNGVFRRPSDGSDAGASALFLIVTWAIVLCTILGPISVGVLVRRVKKLEGRAVRAGGRGTRNVLGVWGVQ